MGSYRASRNYETSTKDFLTTQINANFTGVNVYRGFGEVSGNSLPCVTVKRGLITHGRVELGSFSTRREVLLLIDVFANSEGQLLDLTDYIVSQLKKSWDYNTYTVTNGVSSSTTTGKINCISLTDTILNLGMNKSDLDKVDRYRSLISISVSNGKVEV